MVNGFDGSIESLCHFERIEVNQSSYFFVDFPGGISKGGPLRQGDYSRVSIRLAAVAAAIGSFVGSASTQQSQGFYIGGGAGATISGYTKGALAPNSDSTLSSPRHDLERKWELGTIGVLSLG